MKAGYMHYYSHHGRHKHLATRFHRVISSIGTPLLLIVGAVILATGSLTLPHFEVVNLLVLYRAIGASLLRLFIAFLLSLLIGIPLGLLAERNRRFEAFLLPLYDVLESMPVLAFFPVIILFFLRAGWLEGAAIFIIFFSMVWSITFNTIGGMKVIPQDVQAIGTVFGLSALQRLVTITLPALVPPLVTGSILALASGWNIVIVAEALHAYAPQSVSAHDLFGIGSILVTSAAHGDTVTLLTAMTLLVVVIALINLTIWQPLLGYSERFKFE